MELKNKKMTDEEIRRKVIDIFKETRSKPDAQFNESHFMDFLVEPPMKKDTVKNSFKGVRKYYVFLSRVELEFKICFTTSDQDKYYSIDKFVEKVHERLLKDKGNKMIIRSRMDEKDNYYIELILTVIFLSILASLKFHIISLIAFVLFAFSMWWLQSAKLKDRKHTRELYKRIITNSHT